MSAATIDELTIGEEPERWQQLGFDVADGRVQLGAVVVRLQEGERRGLLGWSLRGITSTELDGLPTRRSQRALRDPAPAHPNGVLAIDHVVAFTPAFERSLTALQAAGLELRRVREEPTPAGAPRQAFFRLGDEILELVQVPDEAIARAGGHGGPARLWGLALTVEDLDLAAERLGDHGGEVRDAVQPGRRIMTVRRAAGLSVPLALMSRAGERVAR